MQALTLEMLCLFTAIALKDIKMLRKCRIFLFAKNSMSGSVESKYNKIRSVKQNAARTV